MGLGGDIHALEDKLNQAEGMLRTVGDEAGKLDQQFTDALSGSSWDGIAARYAAGAVLPGGQQKLHEMMGEFRDLVDDWRSIVGTLSDLVQIASVVVDAASDAIDFVTDIF